jgi:hypothetical protein
MGYETTLLIGIEGHKSAEVEEGDLVIEDGEAYRPLARDKDGEFIPTGRKLTYFMVYATIDLCKCGYSSEISKLARVSADENNIYEWYEGSESRKEDAYGDKPKPVKLIDLITAIEKDNANEKYRRFDWALALLYSMNTDNKDISALMIGH